MAVQTSTRSLIDFALPVNGSGTRIARDIALIVFFSLITAGFARFVVHLPFTPVPITGQTLAVLLAGATLETNYPVHFRTNVSVVSASGTPTVSGVVWGVGA